MTHFTRLALLFALLCLFPVSALGASGNTISSCSSSIADFSNVPCLAGMPRWWDEMMQWVRNLGWDRGRLVQLWLLFMCIGLYIILRIKPRA